MTLPPRASAVTIMEVYNYVKLLKQATSGLPRLHSSCQVYAMLAYASRSSTPGNTFPVICFYALQDWRDLARTSQLHVCVTEQRQLALMAGILPFQHEIPLALSATQSQRRPKVWLCCS